MAINKKLIHFNTFENFNSKKLSANTENTLYTIGINGSVQTGDPEILYQSIVYIKDTKQQWTHGLLYVSDANVQAVDTSDVLDDVETNTYVKYVAQTLTDILKLQVRENIGAGTITGVSANGTSVATSGVANIPAASTSAYGVTKLTSATNSTSTSLAATASAVKAAYDLANSYKGTVTEVKVNGSTKSPSSGTVDLGNVVTSIKINGSTKTPSNGVVDLGTIEGGNSSSDGSEYFNPITLNPSTTAIELVNSGVYILDCMPYANYTITINGQGNFTLLISCNYVYGSISISHKSGKIVWTSEKSPIFTSQEVTELSLCSLPTSTSVGYIVLGTWASYNAKFSNPSGGGGAD